MSGKSLYLPIGIVILAAVIFSNLPVDIGAATNPIAIPISYNTISGGAPARIAMDNSGRYYVTDAYNNSVYIYSNNGVLLSTFSVNKPVGIAVDLPERIFVGNAAEGSVLALDNKGDVLYKLGAGDGEFGFPNDIAVSSTGTIYVTDSNQNLIKAYDLTGTPLFSFGGGIGFPTGIAIDETVNEIYVSDHNNGMIKIFDMNGNLRRTIKGGNYFSSVFIRPQGIALDNERLYIIDAYNSAIVVYGKDGIFLRYIGNYGENTGEFRTPLDIVMDKDNKLFVTNHNNNRTEVIGIDNYNFLNVNPDTLDFSVFENGAAVTQTVNLTSMGSAADWVASASASWVSASLPAGSTPSAVDITVNPSGLTAGKYTAEAVFTTSNGTAAVVLLNLEVKPLSKTLYTAPANMSFKYQQESLNYPSGNITVTSSGGSLSWTASSGAAWISLNSAEGITPSNIKLSINDAVNELNPGTYDASVIIDGGGAQGSPSAVNVSLRVINAGTVKVTTNLAESGFDITRIGEQAVSYSGAGESWSNDEVPPGTYSISFRHVSGYVKPATRTFTVQTGRETTIDGQYRIKSVATNIITGSGGEEGGKVAVFELDGTATTSFEPFTSSDGVRVAAGDLDASGTDKIVVTDHKRTVKVYTSEGTVLASIAISDAYKDTVAAVADIDNDGKADIITGSEDRRHSEKGQRRVLKLLNYADGNLTDKGILYTEDREDEFTIAIGDINGDGLNELIMADKDSVRAFSIDMASGSKLTQIWAVNGDYEEMPEVAAGDINDDGISEIALSIQTGEEESGIIKILKGTGEDYGMTIDAFGDLGYEKASTIALGDIDGDGSDEFIAGAGRDSHNEALVRTYNNNGAFTGLTIKATDNKFGVNVTIGRFK